MTSIIMMILFYIFLIGKSQYMTRYTVFICKQKWITMRNISILQACEMRQLNINIEFYQSYLRKHCVTCVVLHRKRAIIPVPIISNSKILKTAIYEDYCVPGLCFIKALSIRCDVILEANHLLHTSSGQLLLILLMSKLRYHLLQEASPNSPCPGQIPLP